MELSEARRRAEPALAIQRRELAGDDAPNRALAALRAAPAPTVIGLAAALRTGDVEERMLAARLLVDSTLDRDQALAQSRAGLLAESSPEVLRWLATALGHTRNEDAIADLVALAASEHAPIRFAVAGSLSQCAGGAFDSIADTLLTLAADTDADVRWSAAFELGEWLPVSDDERIRARLLELADDPAQEVGAVAQRALDGGSD
ncbi:MAG: HEAT repeat domain-containing protein [Actinomycetota bacterium]